MNLRFIGTLKLNNDSDYFSLLSLKSNATLDLSNLKNCEREDLMDVSLNMSLTNGTDAWSAILTLDFFDVNAAQIKMPTGKYIDLTIQALTNTITGKYIYEIVQNKNGAQFSWKEKMTNDEIMIKLGSCNLQVEDIAKTTLLMLSFCTTRVCELERQTKTSEAEIKSLTNDRERAAKKLDKFVGEKELFEKDLYDKFVAVLNEKKSKIRELKERLREKEDVRSPSTQETPSKSNRRVVKKGRKVKVVPGTSLGKSDYDSGSDTDVEAQSRTSKEAQKNIPNDDLLLDDSQNDSFSFKPRKKTKTT